METAETMVELKVEMEEPPEELVGTSDNSHGVVTIKGGSITDYFKSKMSHIGKKSGTDVKNDTDSESETRTGFGFAYATTKDSDSESRPGFGFASVKTEDESPKAHKQTLRNNLGLENPALDITSPKNEKFSGCRSTPTETERKCPSESSQTPRKAKIDFVFENPALDVTSIKEENETPRKRKSDFAFENPCLELGSTPPDAVRTPKRRRSEFAFENAGLDLESIPGTAELQSSVDPPLPVSEKKKRKKKSKECPRPSEGFTNEALNLASERDEKISSGSQFEVSRSCLGMANDALDLADETNGKKRVTFSETVEYETDSATTKKKKNKNAGKLDKFEVDNEKLKKKRKKSKTAEVDNVFVNEAMDVETLSQEASDNASNERKSERARRKRERKRLSLATIEETPEEEKDVVTLDAEVVTLDESLVGKTSEDLGELSLETPKKKKKKKSKAAPESEAQDDLNNTIDISEENDGAAPEQSIVEKKSKRAKREPEVEATEEGTRSSAKKSKKRKSLVTISDQVEDIEVVDLEETFVGKNDKSKTNDCGVESKSIDKENVEVTTTEVVEGSKKSKKQRKVKNSTENEDVVEKPEEKPANNTPNMQNGSQSPWDGKVKKSKKIFKALFARTPVVHFAGSNINEIKGYGMDV